MKKLQSGDELTFLQSPTSSGKKEYVEKFGINPANQMLLLQYDKKLFKKLIPLCCRLSQDVLSLMIEDENLHDLIMTKCLATPNQLKLIKLWPHKISKYLSTLEQSLSEERGAYLSKEAEEAYEKLCEADPSLPRIATHFKAKSAANCPFAELASLL